MRDAFLAAPQVKPFKEFIKQTDDIVLTNPRTARGAHAKEISEIGSGTVFKPNPELFNATGVQENRISCIFGAAKRSAFYFGPCFDNYSESDFRRRVQSQGFRLCLHS